METLKNPRMHDERCSAIIHLLLHIEEIRDKWCSFEVRVSSRIQDNNLHIKTLRPEIVPQKKRVTCLGDYSTGFP